MHKLQPLCTTVLWPLLICFLVLGCAPKTTVILLPDPDGKTGEVVVSSEGGEVTLQEAGAKTTIKDVANSPAAPRIISEEEIAREYGNVLDALPDQPLHFLLYFLRDSTTLTKDSHKVFPEILIAIDDRDSHDIGVIGHTDTAGDHSYNLRLSTKRANAVAKELIKQGVNENSIKASSHGENNPLVKTGDNVHEPKNRRVEVVVR